MDESTYFATPLYHMAQVLLRFNVGSLGLSGVVIDKAYFQRVLNTAVTNPDGFDEVAEYIADGPISACGDWTTSPGNNAFDILPFGSGNQTIVTELSNVSNISLSGYTKLRITMWKGATAPRSGSTALAFKSFENSANTTPVLILCVAPTPTPIPTSTPSPPITPTPTEFRPVRTPMPPLCIGDCTADGEVTVDELITGVGMVLGTIPPWSCDHFCFPGCTGGPGYRSVTIDCVIRGVNNALSGCLGRCTTDQDCYAYNPCLLYECTADGCQYACGCQ